MVYLFTRLPLVAATQPFVNGSGIFEVTKGRTGETGKSKSKSFAFDINIACSSTPQEGLSTKCSIIAIHIFNVGDRSRYPNNSIIFASGLVVFGHKAQAISFHADAKDIKTLAKGESTADLGTVFCSYVGTAQKYQQRDGGEGVVNGLLHIGLSVKDRKDALKTFALIKDIPPEEAAELMRNLQEGMIVEVFGPLTQIGFGGSQTAPVFDVGSLRSLPRTSGSTGTSSRSQNAIPGPSTSDSQLRRIPSRSVSPVQHESEPSKRPPPSPSTAEPVEKKGKKTAEGEASVVKMPVMGSRASRGAKEEVVIKKESA